MNANFTTSVDIQSLYLAYCDGASKNSVAAFSSQSIIGNGSAALIHYENSRFEASSNSSLSWITERVMGTTEILSDYSLDNNSRRGAFGSAIIPSDNSHVRSREQIFGAVIIYK